MVMDCGVLILAIGLVARGVDVDEVAVELVCDVSACLVSLRGASRVGSEADPWVGEGCRTGVGPGVAHAASISTNPSKERARIFHLQKSKSA